MAPVGFDRQRRVDAGEDTSCPKRLFVKDRASTHFTCVQRPIGGRRRSETRFKAAKAGELQASPKYGFGCGDGNYAIPT